MDKKINGSQSSASQSQEKNRRRRVNFHISDFTTKNPARQQPNVRSKLNLKILLFHAENEILQAEQAGDDDAAEEARDRRRWLLADGGERWSHCSESNGTTEGGAGG